VDFAAETAHADPDFVNAHIALRSHLSMALCLSEQVPEGVAQADRARALAADSRVGDDARATALHAFAFSRLCSEEDIDDALAANGECLALFTLERDLGAARQVRARLLELADQKRT
jgi:hypothetical protein